MLPKRRPESQPRERDNFRTPTQRTEAQSRGARRRAECGQTASGETPATAPHAHTARSKTRKDQAKARSNRVGGEVAPRPCGRAPAPPHLSTRIPREFFRPHSRVVLDDPKILRLPHSRGKTSPRPPSPTFTHLHPLSPTFNPRKPHHGALLDPTPPLAFFPLDALTTLTSLRPMPADAQHRALPDPVHLRRARLPAQADEVGGAPPPAGPRRPCARRHPPARRDSHSPSPAADARPRDARRGAAWRRRPPQR